MIYLRDSDRTDTVTPAYILAYYCHVVRAFPFPEIAKTSEKDEREHRIEF